MMKTENEKLKMKQIEQSLHEVVFQINGETPDETVMASLVGNPLAVLDALFAIRDGQPWRGLNSPEFIARKALQTIGVGD